MNRLTTQGIILKAFPFNDHDRILSLFTPEEGILKLCVKGAYLSRKNHGSHSNPLNLVEATYSLKKSELSSCYELEVIDQHLPLRSNLAILEAACDMLQTVTTTQLPGKAAPQLYQLLCTYLKRLPEASNPWVISTSFRLKTLRYEGLLDSSDFFPMSPEERNLVEVLTLCRDFPLLAPLTITLKFKEQIKFFFATQIQ